MVLRNVVTQFAELGMNPMVGPELEFYILEEDRRVVLRAGSGTARAPATSTCPGSRAIRRMCC